ncbi:TPA: ATP-binding protein [Clostridium perfringens]|nr:ATP-binding protein [Clostridium perfringens]
MKNNKFNFPINFVKENLIFNNKVCYAGFKLNGFEYSSCNNSEKIRILDSLTELIKEIPSEAQILLIPRAVDCERSIRPMINKIQEDDPLKEVSTILAEKTIEILEERAEDRYIFNPVTEENEFIAGDKTLEYDTYIFISLLKGDDKDFISKGVEMFEYMIKSPKKALNEFLGISQKTISERDFRIYKKKSTEFLEIQSMRFDIRPLRKSEIDSLSARVTKRGHQSADELVKWSDNCLEVEQDEEKVIIPLRNAYKNRVTGLIEQGDKILKIQNDGFTSYQTFLAINNIPSMEFPGVEYIKLIQDMNIGAEICIHIKKFSAEESKSKIKNKAAKINAQVNEALQGGHIPSDEEYEAKAAAESLEKEVKRNKHIIETSISICLASTKEKIVRNNTKVLMEYFNKSLKFELINPYTDQYRIFLDFIPANSNYNRDFIQLVPMETLAGGVFGASDHLGDSVGAYIGYTVNGNRKVYLYMGRATKLNKSPAMGIYGNLGGGKSFNANLIVVLHVLFGSSALIFDPKSERSHWAAKLDFMGDLISIVRLTPNDEDKGKLDPFNLYNDNIDEACDLAFNIIVEIANTNEEEKIILKETLNKMKDEKRPSMKRLIEMINDVSDSDAYKKEAERLVRKLNASKDVGLSKLIFGDGTEKAINLDNRLNILQIDNLTIPDQDTKKEEYSEEEKLSSCLMMLMGSFTKKFAMKKRNTFDLILFDESWFLKNSAAGRKLYDFLARQGRSLNVGCIFNGHSVLDIPTEEIKNTITYKLCFKTNNRDEAKRMLEFMNKSVTEENIKMLMELENRQAVFQDLDGRVGVIEFDAVFEQFIECFSTTPEDTLNYEDVS